MATEVGADAAPGGGPPALASPLQLQHLERCLRLEPFLHQVSAVLNRTFPVSDDDSNESGEDSKAELAEHLLHIKRETSPEAEDARPSVRITGSMARRAAAMKVEEAGALTRLGCIKQEEGGDRHGKRVAHKFHYAQPANGFLSAELKAEKAQLYNFSKLKKSRKWMKSILLSDSSESESDGEEAAFSLTQEELHDMLRLHKFRKLHQSRFRSHKELQQYQFYSAGLLSSLDRYHEAHRHSSGPKRKRPKEERKLKAMKKKMRKRRREEQQQRGSPAPWDGRPVARFSQEGTATTSSRRKHLTLEQLGQRRRRAWLTVAKKDIPKAAKQKSSAHNNILTNAKKLAHQCMREVRRASIQTQKNCKETLPRARRLTKEMLLYWKRYEKVEKEHRRRAHKEALEQRKLDEEMREAKRQQRKLNFLITQTELYAHFVGGKTTMDMEQDEILRKLEDSTPSRPIQLPGGVTLDPAHDDYDSEFYKARALRNAEEAFQAHQARTRLFDDEASESRLAALRAADASGTGFGESYSLANPSILAGEDIPQPSFFCGKLKAYQLKGMNWLANLYEQGINGILADEMGLGKTVQSIALLAHLAERENIWGPFLVISPASTLNNWHQEFTRFTPKFKVLPYWGNPHDRKVIRKFWSQKTLFTQDAPFHVVITSYQLVVQDVKYFQRVKWQYMVLDEAQALKSSTSVRWKILLQFQCRNRLLLTGTPIQNTMAELWALLHFIMPTLFDSHEEFNEWFSKDIESHAENKSVIDENQLSRLHMILKPFMLRRIKKDVENELSDKIEVLVYCHLNSRQRLLYQGLKNKISIEDLLQSSMGTQLAHTTTSSLMNLVMQFRKVCNHPDLFERQETRSPFFFPTEVYPVPKLVYRECLPASCNPYKRKLLLSTLSPFAAEHIHSSLFHAKGGGSNSSFSFLRFVDTSPAELSNLMLQGLLVRWLAVFLAMKASYRLQYEQAWPDQVACAPYLHSRALLLSPQRVTSMPSVESSPVLQELVFTAHTSHVLSHVRQAVRSRRAASTVLRECQRSDVPSFLLGYLPKVVSGFRQWHCVDRSAEFERLEAGGAVEQQALLFGSPVRAVQARRPHDSFFPSPLAGLHAIAPLHGWSFIRIPDKETLITDSGKLYALDCLLCRLKMQGHRVLIYSQMTRMIDLLEEYMVYRNHTYIRLDGSSKISERRDMVADFQTRSDIFVFLLSTRAGGLGINLTAADTVIFYDSDWNPTVDQQAMDRAHRLGQTKQVTVYRLICKGTIEERILQRAKEKSEIQKMVISGSNFKPDALKPKEVVSLLLDDEELEKKLRMRQEEKKQQEEVSRAKERKRKRDKYAEKQQVGEGYGKRMRLEIGVAPPSLPSADNSNTSAEWDECYVSVDSAQPSPYSEMSLGSELQPGSIPPDESSNDMLVIVDDGAPASHCSTPTRSVAADQPLENAGRGLPKGRGLARSRGGRSRQSEAPTTTTIAAIGAAFAAATAGPTRGRGRKSTTGSAAAMAGAMAGAAAASAAAYAAYGYSVSKDTNGSPRQAPLVPPPTSATGFGGSTSSQGTTGFSNPSSLAALGRAAGKLPPTIRKSLQQQQQQFLSHGGRRHGKNPANTSANP
uniref:Chromatin-remodeling ATPase INO80 n=1 Tax=Petromyzon marinus TaxID=7757 RepID=A0AAJ7X4G0_PETMA|nr:chromatin-remodeling ATPase INO80 [Petromyzon marinus]XP_032821164.1 chromatin-remodeling ATPase INO80 [Petromyzon marinus]